MKIGLRPELLPFHLTHPHNCQPEAGSPTFSGAGVNNGFFFFSIYTPAVIWLLMGMCRRAKASRQTHKQIPSPETNFGLCLRTPATKAEWTLIFNAAQNNLGCRRQLQARFQSGAGVHESARRRQLGNLAAYSPFNLEILVYKRKVARFPESAAINGSVLQTLASKNSTVLRKPKKPLDMFKSATLLALSTLLAGVSAQNVGTYTAETHPPLTWYKCTLPNNCVAQAGKIVLDANWRWLHSTTSSTNCYTGNTWSTSLAPNNDVCTQNCALDGADYSGTYGITTSGNALTLKFVTSNSNGKNVGSRVYLLNNDTTYEMFKVLNQEITFDVDVSGLPCGLNGAVYFSEMEADGGMAANPTNKAGAKYGTGYCDSQCPKDLKFIAGKCNAEGWTGTSTNSGRGNFGSCCNEMDIWEANSISNAFTPHPCDPVGPYKCTGDECGQPSRYSGVCDPDGCDFNPYRQGDKNFYGPGKTVDTTKKFTLVTQFITDNGTATGNLKEIRRLYVQNGVVIANTVNQIPGIPATGAVSDAYCDAQKSVFGDEPSFQNHGGMTVMGESLKRGGVLVLSIWDDYAVNMHWLNSYFPTDCTGYGCERGTCAANTGVPSEIEVSAASASVTYSNIRLGPIGSTYSGSSSTTTTTSGSTSRTSTTSTTTTTTTTANGATQTHWGQCGGQGYTGPTVCESPYTCTYAHAWYSQCL